MKWPSDTEALILSLLGNAEMYGLSIIEKSEGKIPRGTIYVTLGRMVEKGFLTSRPDEGLRSPPENIRFGYVGIRRILYKRTKLGQRIVKAIQMVYPNGG